MSQRLYDSATAEALMQFAYPEYREQDLKPYEIRENGVYATEAFRDVCPAGTVFNWTPADEMWWPGSPNPHTAPLLPIPFDAAQLAAAMIDGPGQSIAYAMERRLGYPLDDDALNRFSDRMRWMRDALTEAYALAAAAQSVVGEFDHDQQARAHLMAQRYEEEIEQANDREGVFEQGVAPNDASARRARAVASIADLNDRVNSEQAEVAEKWKVWRKAMVRQLLNPVSSTRELSEADCEAETREFTAGFYDARINLGNWTALHDVKPTDAAMLLCGYDPDKGQSHTAKDFVMLARRFTDHAQQYPAPRRLAHWWTLALEWMGAKRLGFITLHRDLGEALMVLDAQHHPYTEPAQPQNQAPPNTTLAAQHFVLHERLKPGEEWRGGRIADTDVLPLDEAARMASKHAAQEVTPADFLRAAGRGEITLHAVVHRTARVRAHGGGVYCNPGEPNENIVPAGCIPLLPLTACKHLADAGRASWRTFDGHWGNEGLPVRYTRGILADDEPDFQTVPADCRVTGYNVRALADAFCDVPQVAMRAQGTEASAPEAKAKSKRRTWWDVAAAYIVEVMRAGQYATVKELYRALEAKAGPNAPFDRGIDANRGSLFVREIAQPLSLKTVQNNWKDLQELAKK